MKKFAIRTIRAFLSLRRDLAANLRRGVLAGVALIAIPWSAPALAQPVATANGLLEGVSEGGVTVFRGIPFAAPPIGPLRWRPPAPAHAWTGVRRADRYAPICPQDGAYPPESPAEPMNEDCLYLNVWVPEHPPGQRLPVMVWIYGGALQNGSASTPLYSGDHLARHGVIVVTTSYRLGALGFLSLDELRRESGSSGNYGLLDQIAALEWVHYNVDTFGGDPGNVTVFGQSSGAISISALVAAPMAKGLFQRAIAESGGLFEPIDLAAEFTPAGAEAAGRRFASRAGAATLAQLRELRPEALLKIPFEPHFVLDGVVLKKSPFETYGDGTQNDVDILVGTNADEGEIFLREKTITRTDYKATLSADFSAPIVWLACPSPGKSDAEARAVTSAFEGDLRFRWDMWTWARLAAAHGTKNAYLYEFAHSPPYREGNRYHGLGATHGMEMQYVFENPEANAGDWTDADRRVATNLAAYWTNFAKTGDPNGPGLTPWPTFKAVPNHVMRLSETPELRAIVREADLHRIDRVYRLARLLHLH
jgi:para-nitrobenzyl esterase